MKDDTGMVLPIHLVLLRSELQKLSNCSSLEAMRCEFTRRMNRWFARWRYSVFFPLAACVASGSSRAMSRLSEEKYLRAAS